MNAPTITEFIDDSKDQEISSATLVYKEVVTNNESEKLITTLNSLYDKYYDDMKEYIMPYTFTEEECTKYYYNPQRFCYDFYGTTEYWALLLDINQMYSASEFHLDKIKIFNKGIDTFVKKIINLEDYNITRNTESIQDTLKE